MTARWAGRAAELTAVFSPQRKYKTVRFKSHLRNQRNKRRPCGVSCFLLSQLCAPEVGFGHLGRRVMSPKGE